MSNETREAQLEGRYAGRCRGCHSPIQTTLSVGANTRLKPSIRIRCSDCGTITTTTQTESEVVGFE